MKFEIDRTQSYYKEAPCAGAKDESYTRLDARGRPYLCKCWTIELSTLEDLLALIEAVDNPIIVSPKDPEYGSGHPELEIYDGYRE